MGEPPLRIIAAIGVLGAIVVASAYRLLRGRSGSGAAAPLVDARPADGEVGLIAMGDVRARPNPRRADLRAYVPGERPRRVALRSRPSRRGLVGRVAVFSVFVGRDGGSWSDAEIAEVYGSLERMGRWVERQAIRRGVAVNLELVDTYFTADDDAPQRVELIESLDPYETILDERDPDVLAVASASAAVARLGFADLVDLIGSVGPRIEADARVWVVHMLRAGRSCCLAGDRMLAEGAGVILSYAGEASASEPLRGRPYADPATLAHELLHLFGATDKYGTPLSRFPAGTVTSRDIMRLDVDRLSSLRIDPLTAAEVGWGAPTTG